MNKFNSYKSKEFTKSKLLAIAGGVGLAALTLVGCGSNKEAIGVCPDGFSTNAAELSTPSAGYEAMQEGVATLRTKLSGDDTMSKIRVPLQLNGAVANVFNEKNELTWDLEQNTRVDELGEVICSDNDKYYYTPDSQQAIGGLASAGINVKIEQ